MFSPLAYRLGFCIAWGSYIYTCASNVGMLLKKNVREKKNKFLSLVSNGAMRIFA